MGESFVFRPVHVRLDSRLDSRFSIRAGTENRDSQRTVNLLLNGTVIVYRFELLVGSHFVPLVSIFSSVVIYFT